MSIKKKSIADLKNTILSPSLTSLYKVDIPLPDKVRKFIDGKVKVKVDQESISILCSSASLPGSSLMTHEIMNDHTGVSEFHAHRRQFDNKIELEFYVDSDLYGPIIYFEYWMDYISQYTATAYRMQYPRYYRNEFKVYKFERDINKSGTHTARLEYSFFDAFPLSINSMPISYNTSSLLKCVVTMSYSRYAISNKNLQQLTSKQESLPEEQKRSSKINDSIVGNTNGEDERFISTDNATGYRGPLSEPLRDATGRVVSDREGNRI